MKKINLIFAAILILISSCGSTNPNEKNDATNKTQEGRIDINVAEFKEKMNGEDVVILDVRTPLETKEGIIPGAIEIDVKGDGFKEKVKALDREKTYLVYCRSGRRSVAACDIMEREGFKKLYNLLGGYNDYSKQ